MNLQKENSKIIFIKKLWIQNYIIHIYLELLLFWFEAAEAASEVVVVLDTEPGPGFPGLLLDPIFCIQDSAFAFCSRLASSLLVSGWGKLLNAKLGKEVTWGWQYVTEMVGVKQDFFWGAGGCKSELVELWSPEPGATATEAFLLLFTAA